MGRPSNPFGSGAPIQWRALGKLTDFEVPRHPLGKLTDFEAPRHPLQYNIIQDGCRLLRCAASSLLFRTRIRPTVR